MPSHGRPADGSEAEPIRTQVRVRTEPANGSGISARAQPFVERRRLGSVTVFGDPRTEPSADRAPWTMAIAVPSASQSPSTGDLCCRCYRCSPALCEAPASISRFGQSHRAVSWSETFRPSETGAGGVRGVRASRCRGTHVPTSKRISRKKVRFPQQPSRSRTSFLARLFAALLHAPPSSGAPHSGRTEIRPAIEWQLAATNPPPQDVRCPCLHLPSTSDRPPQRVAASRKRAIRW